MNTIKQSVAIGVRGIRHLIHHPITMVFTLFNPLVWFFIYGQLFKGVAQIPGFPTDNYTLFVLPGVLGIAILSVTLFNANNVVIIGLPFTGGLAAGWIGVILVYILSIMFGFSMTYLGLSMSLASNTAWEFFGMVNFIQLPLFFMSSALFPQDFMPKWLSVVAQFNPLSHYVNAVRSLYIDGLDWSVIGLAAGVLFLFNILLFFLVKTIYRKVVAV